ncbi:signal peptidase I [Pelagibius sp. Alg239-R121]|uniref:signal peptidase I n=1 Tax=Pelagibius sp. Alg239-R121 TaxID=2993448 RepID=UPI002AC34254|nr:signal peptidase I [Pelagibius sp. Alg239-R121]
MSKKRESSDLDAESRVSGSGESGEAPGAAMETIKTVVYAVLIAFLVRTFAYEPFNIPSGSMKPTLLVGDYLFVSKFSYGYSHYSLPFSPKIFSGRILADEPERGDVAVFKEPRDNKTDYIKRIVGLPGDTIQVVGGILHINGTPVKREKVTDRPDRNSINMPTTVTEYVETLPNGVKHLIWEEGDARQLDNTRAYTVPEGHYFGMGDNRDNSQDSRVIGFIPAENLIGRAEFLFFSHDSSARIWEIWKWPSAIRFGRLGDGID